MKNLFFLSITILYFNVCSAQTFSDDFESYSSGDYLGASSNDWTTWSGSTGGTEDVQVTTVQANSGSNSIYFSSIASGGGPQDVVLPFGGEHNTGTFSFSAAFYIEAGKGAYFNFQEKTSIGVGWAMNCNIANGMVSLDNGVALASGPYTDETWFELQIDIDLSTNTWELFLDNVSQGTFSNPTCQVASLDLFPLQGNGFYVDDVSYTVTPYTLPNLNAGLVSITMGELASTSVEPSIQVRNLGTSTINSFNVELYYNGSHYTEVVTGLTLSSLDVHTVNFTNPVMIVSGANNATATLSNVNGNASDDDSSDDSKTVLVDPLTPAIGKLVIGEEATGTWCGWCPRGAVGLINMDTKYHGLFQGIAVHNGDPMTDSVYDAGIGPYISGYPSALVDRGSDIDPGAFEGDFLERIVIPPVAFITTGATYDTINRILNVSITAEFQQCISGNYKVACAIIEDSVTGTTSDYDQSNYYAGGGSGEMGGFESLPNPVPASQMQYDHVARSISPSFEGLDNAYPDSTAVGYSHTHTFSFTLSPAWDENQIHIVGMLMDPAGRMDNAGSVTITEAESTGLTNDGIVFVPGNVISATMTSTNPTDTNTCDGSATANPNGGSPPYNYLWSDASAQTTAMATSLCAGTYTVDITDCVGATESMTVTLTAQTPTNTQIFDGPDAIKLYPNPSNSMTYLNIELEKPSNVSIKVLNAIGQVVMSRNYGKLNGPYTLPIAINRLNNGIYSVNIEYNNMIKTKKLMINK